MSNKALRYNKDKEGMHLLPLDALREISKVYDMGAIKYAPHNWRNGFKWNEGIVSSLLRHLEKFSNGEDYDEESGLLHSTHIAWNAIALVEHQINDNGEDDRWKTQLQHTQTNSETPQKLD